MSLLNVLQKVEGVAETTLTTAGPVVLQALALVNPGVAKALQAVEALLAATNALVASGAFTQAQADGAVAAAAQGVVAAHTVPNPAAPPLVA